MDVASACRVIEFAVLKLDVSMPDPVERRVKLLPAWDAERLRMPPPGVVLPIFTIEVVPPAFTARDDVAVLRLKIEPLFVVSCTLPALRVDKLPAISPLPPVVRVMLELEDVPSGAYTRMEPAVLPAVLNSKLLKFFIDA